MPINDTTASRGYQKPNVSNLLSDDVARLRAALEAIDVDVAALLSLKAALASPTFTGTPSAPTAAGGTNTTQLATTAFVAAAIAALIDSAPGALDTLDELAAALGDDANFAATMTNALALKAALASPEFTGLPKAPTAAVDTSTTQLATTAFVIGQGYLKAAAAAGLYASSSSPTFTGTVNLAALAYSGAVTTTSTGVFALPSGTTAQRPGSPVVGLRFNNSLGQFEGWNGTQWGAVGGGAAGGGADRVFYENDQTVTSNYTITSGKNAVSAGPVTINAGVVVTIPAGSTWRIV
jgi:hypothetical protein